MPITAEANTPRAKFEAEMQEITSAVQRAWAAEGLAPDSGPWDLEDVFDTMGGRTTSGPHVSFFEAAMEARHATLHADSDELERLLRALGALQNPLDAFSEALAADAPKLEHRLRNAVACNRVEVALNHERATSGAESLLGKVRRFAELTSEAGRLLLDIIDEIDARRSNAFRVGAFEPNGGGPRTVVIGRLHELGAAVAEITDALGDVPPPPSDRTRQRAWRQKRDAARAAVGQRLQRYLAKLQAK